MKGSSFDRGLSFVFSCLSGNTLDCGNPIVVGKPVLQVSNPVMSNGCLKRFFKLIIIRRLGLTLKSPAALQRVKAMLPDFFYILQSKVNVFKFLFVDSL